MKTLGLNTVLVPAYWELMEPTEGKFDFTLIDSTIQQARNLQLKVVFLWFGAWKNSMSCYAPLWFKQDTKRFPRARTQQGKPLEIACCFSENVFQADNKAFEALVKHICETGSDVVTMIQVENEIGMLEDARDHSPLAEEVYQKGVPQELISYLKKNQKTLHPWLKARINSSLFTLHSSLSWKEVFGDDIYTDEIFMAYYYAKYVGRLCETARKYTQMPLYVNAAMNSRGRQPGQYPSAGPLAHLIDLWHYGAPQLLCLAPDIYDTGFKGWADQYALPNNRLFIPESRCCENSGARAMYAFGEHQALGFSPFAIDQASPKETESVSQAYNLLRQVYSLASHHSPLTSYGFLFDQEDKERIIENDGMVITCRHYFTLPWDPRATDGSTWPEGGAILQKLANNEYLLAGTGVVVTFASAYEKTHAQQQILGEDGFVAAGTQDSSIKSQVSSFKGARKGIASVDEVSIDEEGRMHYQRRLNGDQDHQGRHVRIACGEWKILHVRLYDYK
ncbi:MAG: DUF5597 domain-containing protein [Prevotella sp.]|nr:DUF5597 domain-containing protein [Prevotella sp.]